MELILQIGRIEVNRVIIPLLGDLLKVLRVINKIVVQLIEIPFRKVKKINKGLRFNRGSSSRRLQQQSDLTKELSIL